MKKLLLVLLLVLSVLGFAQEGSIKPEFQAFSGALLKLKPAEGGYHKFSLKVDVAPWAFQAIGEVRAPAGDPELLINALFDGEVYAVLAYVPQMAQGTDGQEYYVGLFEMMLYYDEEPTTIRNLKFKLLPPANDEWALGILKDALESGSLLGEIWKGKYEGAITKASADPMDKKKLQALQKKKKGVSDEEETPLEKKKKKLRNDDEDDQPVARNLKKKKSRDEDEEEPVVKKKKKKKSYDEDEEEPVVKKKKKKKRDDDEDEDDTPKKKKKKSYSDDDDDECNDPSLSVKEKRRCEMKKNRD